MEKVDKRIVHDIVPNETYKRNSEGDFIRLFNGDILFAYTCFTGGMGDQAASKIVGILSKDEGETWSLPFDLIHASTFDTQNVMSVSLMRMQNQDIGLFFIVKQTLSRIRIMLARFQEDLSNPVFKECTLQNHPGWYVLNNQRAERLQSGRIVLPLASHRTGHDEQGNVFFDSCSSACFLLSDDDGQSFFESPSLIHPPFSNTQSGLQEPGIIERKNGVLHAYFRTDKMYQYQSFSFDQGMTFTTPEPSHFTSPLSPMKIVRKEDTLYAFFNPIPNYLGRQETIDGVWTGGRTPFVFVTSKDEGNTWSDFYTIEDDKDHGYCYPAIFFTNDAHMLVGYCAGGIEDKSCLARLKICKIKL